MFDFKELVSTAVETISEHSPAILAGVAIAGTITAVMLAAKASRRASEALEKAEDDLDEEDIDEDEKPVKRAFKRFWRAFKITWKIWLPTALAVIVTISAVIGSNTIAHNRLAALSAAYALSESDRIAYREAAKEVVGDEKELDIRKRAYEKRAEERKSSVTEDGYSYTGKGSTRMYDAIGERRFLCDVEEIYAAILRCNNKLNGGLEPYLSLNDVYQEIGLRTSYLGSIVGWAAGDEIKLDEMSLQFPDLVGDNEFVLDFETRPYPEFRDRLHG